MPRPWLCCALTVSLLALSCRTLGLLCPVDDSTIASCKATLERVHADDSQALASALDSLERRTRDFKAGRMSCDKFEVFLTAALGC